MAGEVYASVAKDGQQNALTQFLNLKRIFQDAQRQNQIEMIRDQRKQLGEEHLQNQRLSSEAEQKRLDRINQLKQVGIMQGAYTPSNEDVGMSPSAMATGTPAASASPSSDTMTDPRAAMSLANGGIGDAAGNQITPQLFEQAKSQSQPQTGWHASTKFDEKKTEFNQRQWTMFVNKNTPTLASSRSTLGMAANGNLRADRALVSIQNDPTMTYQDLGNVVGDLAGIYQGGAPTDQGMKHQQYDSIQTYLANIKQYMTGKPQDSVPPAIKQKLIKVIQNLKSVNNDAIDQHFTFQEKAQKNLIANFPDQWSEMKQNIKDNYGFNGQQSSQKSDVQSSNQSNSDDRYQQYLRAVGQ